MNDNGRSLPPDPQERLRRLPALDHLLRQSSAETLVERFGRAMTVSVLREVLEARRTAILAGRMDDAATEGDDGLIDAAALRLEALLNPALQPVINATGVIIHTNLGRAPLSTAAGTAVATVAADYSTLEYDITTGRRGRRAAQLEAMLCRLTGTEASLAVNNNAAAVLLMLAALCHQGEVIISRGQLVEIGGGFRVPDVMAQSGARLVEVGTTNRTHLRDYAAAISSDTAAILIAHHSNFKIVGFTSEPSLKELAELAHHHDVPLLYDQGSGALVDTTPFGLGAEPTVLDGVRAGCDVVAFSGDKLLGGPQAGLLVGRSQYMDVIRRHPLARAVRADKLALAGLTATIAAHLSDRATTELPVWQMIARSAANIEATAVAWTDKWRAAGIAAAIMPGESTVGGGSLPGATLPTTLVALDIASPDRLFAQLRHGPTPVIGRIERDRFVLDPRTVLPHQEAPLLAAVSNAFSQLTESAHE